MAEKTASSSATPKEPTPADISFMVNVFKLMQEKPNIDWDAFAAAAGFKNASVAHVRYRQIRQKFDTNEAAAPSTPKKKKANEGPGSASKVTKSAGRVGTKGKKGKTAAKAEEDEVDGAAVKSEEDVDEKIDASQLKLEDNS